MTFPLTMIQFIFIVICLLFSVNLSTHYFEGGANWINITIGILGGGGLSGMLLGIDSIFSRYNLRTFNTIILGLFLGYLMAEGLLLSVDAMIDIHSHSENLIIFRFFTFLSCIYLGLTMTLRSSEEIRVCIPFVEFKQMSHKKKDILVDLSILNDPRLIDLASTGLLDHHLIIPRFAVRELYAQAENGDESAKTKSKRSLEMIKKLECLPSLEMRYVDTDFPEIKEPMSKLIRLARYMDTHIITSDMNRIQQSSIEGVRIINIHMLSNALKPITQSGEAINIKIQRYGKEPRQGVGYLEDGTMVVVNGGAEFIGETIRAYVLSVKHTSSGRMVFCNAADEESNGFAEETFQSQDELEETKNYLNI